MDKEKLITFLKFIGIESTDMQEQIRQARFDLTSIILSMAAEKTGKSEDTIKDWYTQFSNMQQTESNFLDAVKDLLTDKKPEKIIPKRHSTPPDFSNSIMYASNDRVTQSAIEKLEAKLKICIIEGLNKKGFRFDNDESLQLFIKARCRCEDNKIIKQRVYFVEDTPFLLHNYTNPTVGEVQTTEFKMTSCIEYGTFAYL